MIKYYTVKPHITATFLAVHFLAKKTLINTAKCFGPLATVLTEFHCT